MGEERGSFSITFTPPGPGGRSLLEEVFHGLVCDGWLVEDCLSERTQERLIQLVLALLRKEVFQCETIEEVNELGQLISLLEGAHEGENAFAAALDFLAGHYEF